MMPESIQPAAGTVHRAGGPTQKVGLVGWPVEHSVSPAMHNAAFDALGLKWRYSLLPTPPERVGSVLAQIRREGYQGANVTVPHKLAVMPFLDEITGAASAMGAVNTIQVQDKRLVGHNTDSAGFLAALREAGCEPSGQRALVLGAGGGARAVTYALAQVGCPVTIHNRTVQRAVCLAQEMGELGLRTEVSCLPHTADLEHLDLARFDLLVNTTPAGMWPKVETSPWPETLPMPSHWVVYDLVYNPEETRLLARARATGATPVVGLGMLVHQGALAFELWTGQAPPVAVMYAAARDALGKMVDD
jgi:shikimate dehydrogenase